MHRRCTSKKRCYWNAQFIVCVNCGGMYFLIHLVVACKWELEYFWMLLKTGLICINTIVGLTQTRLNCHSQTTAARNYSVLWINRKAKAVFDAICHKDWTIDTWLEPPVLYHCAMTTERPPAPTILYMWKRNAWTWMTLHSCLSWEVTCLLVCWLWKALSWYFSVSDGKCLPFLLEQSYWVAAVLVYSSWAVVAFYHLCSILG